MVGEEGTRVPGVVSGKEDARWSGKRETDRRRARHGVRVNERKWRKWKNNDGRQCESNREGK